jgi:hypothetical protein
VWAIGAVAGLALPMVGLLAAPAGASVPRADAGSGTATVKLAVDAWYAAGAACTSSPAGCLPAGAPAPPYPAKTLHAGVLAGQEESRTYLSLDLLSLPPGTALTGGTLQLPIAGPDDGTRAAESATLQACLVTATVKDDVEGTTEAPPSVDCKKATSPAKYVAAAGSAPEMLTVDLAPFAAAWSSGSLQQGIALLPAADTSPASAWHVAMSAHDRSGSTVPAPTAQVAYASSAASGDDFDDVSLDAPVADSTGSSSVSFAAAPLAPQPAELAPAAAPAVEPNVAPQAAPVAPAQPQITPQAFVGGGFAYPGVFLVPILLAAAGGWLAHALTRDLNTA